MSPSGRERRGPRPACCEPGLFSQLFHRCQRAVQALPSRARRACSEQEERLLRNVVASLAQALQELSTGFRLAQSGYLKRECPGRREGCRAAGGSALEPRSRGGFHPPVLLSVLPFVPRLSRLALELIPTFRQKEAPSQPQGGARPGGGRHCTGQGVGAGHIGKNKPKQKLTLSRVSRI